MAVRREREREQRERERERDSENAGSHLAGQTCVAVERTKSFEGNSDSF
jgi:hypothetical protein